MFQDDRAEHRDSGREGEINISSFFVKYSKLSFSLARQPTTIPVERKLKF